MLRVIHEYYGTASCLDCGERLWPGQPAVRFYSALLHLPCVSWWHKGAES